MDSILSQTFRDFEIVLLDDGSKDDSGLICDNYAQEHSQVRVIHKENEGLMMTRRRGFQEAQGEFFICVDSDDKLLDCRALEKIYSQIRKTNCDLVLYNYCYGAGGGRRERIREILDYPDGYVFEGKEKKILYDRLLTTNFMNNIWIKCPSRKIVDIDTDYSVWKKEICRAEDLFQSLPILDNATRVGYVKEPLYYYRWASESISNKVKFGYYDSFRCIDSRADFYVNKWQISNETIAQLINQRVLRINGIICKCYFKCKSNNDISKWKAFIQNISDDSYYINILNGSNSSDIILYYRLLHFLIIKKRINMAILLIENVSFFSKIKQRLKG